jgi:sec-independent protein translocase protein TatA
MSMPGGMEWVLIALVVLLLFGGKKIPELAKGLGSGIKNFKKAVKDDENEEVVEAKVKEDEKIATNTTSTQDEQKAQATTSESNKA